MFYSYSPGGSTVPDCVVGLIALAWSMVMVLITLLFDVPCPSVVCPFCFGWLVSVARQKAVELTTIWKDKNVTSAMKIRVMKSMVWAVFQYGVEGWTLKK